MINHHKGKIIISEKKRYGDEEIGRDKWRDFYP
jgi:hypothetical protein